MRLKLDCSRRDYATAGALRRLAQIRPIRVLFGRAILGLALAPLGGYWLLAQGFAQEAPQQLPIDPARRTPTVRLIERCLPSVVAIRAFSATDKPNEDRINLGSGTIIHPAGYILTNFHILQGAKRGEAALPGGGVFPYTLVAGFAHEDLALVKISSDAAHPALPLGRSHDLLLGEPAIAIGSPAGLVSTASEGIVSGLKRSTSTEQAFLPTMIQTSAAISGGSSGGPLLNALGELIGVVTSRKADAENIGFAIAIDRVREILPAMLASEQRYGFQLGLTVDMLASSAKVVAVAPDSPAAMAGIMPGDVIERIDGAAIQDGVAFQMALVERKPGEKLSLAMRRGQELRTADCVLAELPLIKPVADEGLEPGLNFAAWQGMWQQLPDFSQTSPAETGKAERPAANVYKSHPDHFDLELTGLLKVPADGLYTLLTRSDDGSRLYVDDRLVVDNDGMHPPRESAGMVRLLAGLHPIKLQFFESTGDELLQVWYEGPGVPKQEIPAAAYFRAVQAK